MLKFFVCFQSGRGRQGIPCPLPEVVVASGHKKHGAWKMEIVSEPIFFYIYIKLIIAVNTSPF